MFSESNCKWTCAFAYLPVSTLVRHDKLTEKMAISKPWLMSSDAERFSMSLCSSTQICNWKGLGDLLSKKHWNENTLKVTQEEAKIMSQSPSLHSCRNVWFTSQLTWQWEYSTGGLVLLGNAPCQAAHQPTSVTQSWLVPSTLFVSLFMNTQVVTVVSQFESVKGCTSCASCCKQCEEIFIRLAITVKPRAWSIRRV